MLKQRTIILLTLVATFAIGVVGPAAAGPRPRVDLRGASVGTYVLDAAGTAQLAGAVTGVPFDGSYTATLAAADGTLPDPGICEAGTATLHVTGPRNKYLHLDATGNVCGLWTGPNSVVTHRLTGRYVVTDTTERKVRNTDGWIGVSLHLGGGANVEAIDT